MKKNNNAESKPAIVKIIANAFTIEIEIFLHKFWDCSEIFGSEFLDVSGIFITALVLSRSTGAGVGF